MKKEQEDYLFSRGYTQSLKDKEEIFEVESDEFWIGQRLIKDCQGCLAWLVRSMSGTPFGVQTREIENKKYRWHQMANCEHLPMVYGSEEDWDILWNTRQVVFTEGVFDRIALKRALPNYAVLARLSKGISNQLVTMVDRYVDVLWSAFDNDEKGQEAADKTEKTFRDSKVQINRLIVPLKDPSEYLQKRGIQALTSLIQKQVEVWS